MLNTTLYTPVELFLFVGGCFLWVVIYIILIRRAHTINYIEMPILVAAGNIAWEFLWSFPFSQMIDMGWLVVWGYRLWFIMDVYIFFQAIRLGKNTTEIPLFQRNFTALALILAVAWSLLFYTYIRAGYETNIGAMTAYIDNLVISILYVLLILKPSTDVSLLSTPVAWLKMIGTGMNSVMMFLHFHSVEIYAGAHLLHIICVFVFVLDCLYIYWLLQRKRTQKQIV